MPTSAPAIPFPGTDTLPAVLRASHTLQLQLFAVPFMF